MEDKFGEVLEIKTAKEVKVKTFFDYKTIDFLDNETNRFRCFSGVLVFNGFTNKFFKLYVVKAFY